MIGVMCLSLASLPLFAQAALSDAELAIEMQKLRDVHEPHLALERQSSVLGALPDGREAASTHLDLRQEFMGKPLRQLSAAEKNSLSQRYGKVQFFLNPRSGPHIIPLGSSGAFISEWNNESAVTVERIEKDSPAATTLQLGDIIVGAYGHLFLLGGDPRVPLGYAIADAKREERKGILYLDVVRDVEVLQVAVDFGIEGRYADTWPFNCKKSDMVGERALRCFLDKLKDSNTQPSVWWDKLFLMGMDDQEALEAARRSFYKLLKQKQPAGDGLRAWGGSYSLINLCEYYLLTGDSAVLEFATERARRLAAGQMDCGSWSHGCPPGGYGAINNVGSTCYLGLALAREAGITVGRDMLLRSIRHFGRGVGQSMPYGDHGISSSHYGGAAYNGHNATMAMTLSVLGAPDMAAWTARPIGYAYRNRLMGHGARFFAISWGAPGVLLAPRSEFNLYMNNSIWQYELARKRDGSHQPLMSRGNMANMDFTYALPKRKLRILGAPKGVFGTRPPVALEEAMALFKAKQWDKFKGALDGFKASSESEQKYATDLKAAYQKTEAHYQATLALIKQNIKEKNPWLAKEQLNALIIFIGSERQEISDLLAKVGAKPKQKTTESTAKVAEEQEYKGPWFWDVLLEKGVADQGESWALGLSADQAEPTENWAAFDYQPSGWSKDPEKKWDCEALLIRREFSYDSADKAFDGMLADLEEDDDDDMLLDEDKDQKAGTPAEYSTLCFEADASLRGDIYLNGMRICAFKSGSVESPPTRRFDLDARALNLLKPGRNVLAIKLFGNVRMTDGLLRVGVGPSQGETTEMLLRPPAEASGGGRNGWQPDHERFRLDCRWFFSDKTPEECARFLSHPVNIVIQEAVAAIVRRGPSTLPLMSKLITDKHPGIRMGAWDVIAAMHEAGHIDDAAARKIFTIAAADTNWDDQVLQAMPKVLRAFNIDNSDTGKLALIMANSSNSGTRGSALELVRNSKHGSALIKDPVTAVKVATECARNWQGVDPGAFGAIWSVLRENIDLPETRDSIPAIALALDNKVNYLRGMFSDGCMGGSMPVILKHMDAANEDTPHLISGLIKCYIKAPKSAWPGWPPVQRGIKRNIYNFSPAVADKMATAVKQQQQWLNMASPLELAGLGMSPPIMQLVLDELVVWVKTMKKMGKGNDDALFLELSKSDKSTERMVAVSAAWAGLCQDPKNAIKVAINVVDHVEGNDADHNALAWTILAKHNDMPEVRAAIPAIGKALNASVHDDRSWLGLYVNQDIIPVLHKHIDKDNVLTPGLVAGICKCAAKAAPIASWSHISRSYMEIVEKLPPAAATIMQRTEKELQQWYVELLEGKHGGLVRILIDYHWAGSPPSRDPKSGKLLNGRARIEGRIGKIAQMVVTFVQAEGADVIKLDDDEILDKLEDEL